MASHSATVEGPIGGGEQALRRPEGIPTVRTRHVLGDGRMPSPDGGYPATGLNAPKASIALLQATTSKLAVRWSESGSNQAKKRRSGKRKL